MSGSFRTAVLALFAVVVSLLFVRSEIAYGWGNADTHQRITSASLDRFAAGGVLDRFLLEEYEVEDEVLRTQILRPEASFAGAPPEWTDYYASIAEDFAQGRFEVDLADWRRHLTGRAGPANSLLIPQNGEIRVPLKRLFFAGVFAEDNPNLRARNHFHDPEVLHPPPAGDRGLDNSGLLDLLQDLLVRLASMFRGWDNYDFDATGISALDRALNRSPDGSSSPTQASPSPNLFDLGDAERYLYRWHAGVTQEEREHALGLHFLAVAHVLHLLEDMTSPAHVRNDFIVDHALPGAIEGIESLPVGDGLFRSTFEVAFGRTLTAEAVGTALEKDAEDVVGQALLDQIVASGDLFVSRPRRFLESAAQVGVDVDPSQFVASVTPVDANEFDAADFWQLGVVDTPMTSSVSPGVAERVHDNFFSRNALPLSNPDGYERPATDGACQRLPLRDRYGDLVLDSSGEPRLGWFLSSPIVPHLALCTYHGTIAGLPTPVPSGEEGFGYTVIESSVKRDYLELLLPLAIDYTENFLAFYFSPRIEVVPVGENEFKLRNRHHLEFQVHPDAIEIAYDDTDGKRQTVSADCSGSTSVISLPPVPSTGGTAPLSAAACSLPQSLPAPAANRGDFWVLARGRLGSRGFAEPGAVLDDFGADEFTTDFVLGYDHVQSSILVERRNGSGPPTNTDSGDQIDVFAVRIDPVNGLGEDGLGPPASNLTAGIRESVGLPDLDFVVPEPEPEGIRIALRSDRSTEPATGALADVDAPLSSFLLDPSLDPATPGALQSVPDSLSDDHVLLSSEGRMSWSADGALFFSTEETSGLDLKRWLVDSGESPKEVVPAVVAGTTEIQGDNLPPDAEEIPDDLDVGFHLQICSGTRQANALDANTILVSVACNNREVVEVPQDPPLPEPVKDLQVTGESSQLNLASLVDSDSAPDEFEFAYASRLDRASGGTDDCSTGENNPCALNEGFDGSIRPELSPDGSRVAFLECVDCGTILTIPPGQGAARRLIVADLEGAGGIDVLAEVEIGDAILGPTWSPEGRWIAYATVATGEIFVVPVEDLSAEPLQVTQGADVRRTLAWYGPLLLPE